MPPFTAQRTCGHRHERRGSKRHELIRGTTLARVQAVIRRPRRRKVGNQPACMRQQRGCIAGGARQP